MPVQITVFSSKLSAGHAPDDPVQFSATSHPLPVAARHTALVDLNDAPQVPPPGPPLQVPQGQVVALHASVNAVFAVSPEDSPVAFSSREDPTQSVSQTNHVVWMFPAASATTCH